MTLDELIQELQRVRQEFPHLGDIDVETEGCDCDGSIGSVVVEGGSDLLSDTEFGRGYVYLKRP